MGATRTCVLTLLALSGCVSFVEATYGGTCYDYFGVNATTCSDVYETCSYMSSCSNTNGKLSYYCYDMECSGTWTQDSSNTSGTIDVCQTVSFSTCEEADTALTSIGCTCSKCSAEYYGYIDVKCYHPFNCSVHGYSEYYWGSDEVGDFNIQILVYCLVAAALVTEAIGASLCCPPRHEGEPSTKELVRKKLSCVGRGIYRLVLASFVLEDGTPMPFIDYFCDKRDLFGVIACCKMPNLRPRWMRLGGIVGTLLATISLAFIFGTYIYNNERCSYSQDTCDGAPMAVDCEEAYVSDAYIIAYIATTVLSLGISEVSSLAVSSVKMGSLRQKLQVAVTLLTATGLVIYGVLFSNSWSKGDIGDDYNGDSRRLQYIGFLLVVGWVVAEAAGIGLVLLRFLTCRIFYSLVFRSRLEEEKKSAGAAAIHPQNQKINDAIIESGLDGSNQPKTGVKVADTQSATDDITPDSANNPKTLIEAADTQQPTSTPDDLTPDSAETTTEAGDSKKTSSTSDDVTPDSAELDSAKNTTTPLEAVSIQKQVITPDDVAPGPTSSPKTTTESAGIQKQGSTPAAIAPGSASSPRNKIGDGEDKPRLRFTGDKPMNTRIDRKKLLTENIKLEPPKRGDHQ